MWISEHDFGMCAVQMKEMVLSVQDFEFVTDTAFMNFDTGCDFPHSTMQRFKFELMEHGTKLTQ